MDYRLPAPIPADPLAPGTHLLGVSPPMTGLRQLGYRYAGAGLTAGEATVVVTTDRDATAVAEAIDSLAPIETLGIVDATDRDPEPDAVPCRLESAGSPADLTGIGIGVVDLIEEFHESGADRYRLLVDSVSSLLVYSAFERVYRLLHSLTNHLSAAGGTSLSLLTSGVDDQAGSRLEGLADGVIELRESPDPQIRVRGLGGSGEWQPFDAEPIADERSSDPAVEAGSGSDGAAVPAAFEEPASLAVLIDAMATAGYTLTIANYDGGDDVLAEIREYMERLNVSTRTATLSTDWPANAALLHRGEDVLAATPVAELHNAIGLEAIEADAELLAGVTPELLEHVHRSEYAVENGGKIEMVKISRLVETRALETGAGELHTGFQRIDRVADELGTRQLYESIAEAGVEVHLYGEPGSVPREELYTLHTGADPELSESWFVVHDGADQAARKAALVSEERAPGRYTGFWTYQPELVDSVTGYLTATY